MRNAIIVAIIALALGFLLGYTINSFSKKSIPAAGRSVIERDTVVKLIKSEPVIIEKIKPEIHYLRDTIIETKPFIARIDTVILRDTVMAEYIFPQNLLSMKLSRGSDSLRVEQLNSVEYLEDEKEWWELPAYVLAGVILGFLLGGNK